jgi:ubiquinol-cytochrome c reductase cytochrome b subunit
VFFPGAVLPVLIFSLTAGYPFLERRFTGDRSPHHVLQRARETPVRAGIGAGGLTFYGLLILTAMDDQAARFFHLPIEGLVWALRVLIVGAPLAAFGITYLGCRRLGRPHDEDSGERPERFVRTDTGDYAELRPEPPVRAG